VWKAAAYQHGKTPLNNCRTTEHCTDCLRDLIRIMFVATWAIHRAGVESTVDWENIRADQFVAHAHLVRRQIELAE